MITTRRLTFAAVAVALAACNPFRSPFKQEPVTEVSRDVNANARWHGTLTSPSNLAGVVQISGTVEMTPGSKAGTTHIAMNVSNATPGGVHPWQLHYGACGSDEGVFGGNESYSALKIDDKGKAWASVNVPRTMPTDGRFHVSVGASKANPETIVACGNLAAPSA